MNATLEVVLKGLCCYSVMFVVVFIFALSLCKVAARADEEMEN